jgi:hypothetical protein
MSATKTASRSSRRIVEEAAPRPATDNKRQETATNGNGSGRDSKGRFTAGNPGGPGNPFARRVAQLRSVMLQCITDEDMQAITHAVLLKARNGDLQAVKLMYQYGIGKASDAVNPDTLDIDEYKQIYEPQKDIMEDVMQTMHTIPPGALTPVVRAMNKECMKQMGAVAAAPPEVYAEMKRNPAAYLSNLARDEAAGPESPRELHDENDTDGPEIAPSPKGSNGARPQEQPAPRPSPNRLNGNGDGRDTPSTKGSNGPTPSNGGKRRPHGLAQPPSINRQDGRSDSEH